MRNDEEDMDTAGNRRCHARVGTEPGESLRILHAPSDRVLCCVRISCRCGGEHWQNPVDVDSRYLRRDLQPDHAGSSDERFLVSGKRGHDHRSCGVRITTGKEGEIVWEQSC